MRPNRRSIVLASLALLALSYGALAEDLPTFRKGLWEYKRTVEDSTTPGKPIEMKHQKCSDPTADMKSMNEQLTRQGCKFSPAVKSGHEYTFSAECQMQGVTMTSHTVVTVESDSAYQARITSTAGDRSTQELLIAKRLGDC